jgi:CheY-like chemotaxis protein
MSEELWSEVEKQILFVDDEEPLALLGAELLEDFGYTVTCAFDGREALKLFQQQPDTFDMVITDESMSGMSGIELAQKLCRISPATPVILWSGYLLTMQEEGMDTTNIKSILTKTEACIKLPRIMEQIFADEKSAEVEDNDK